MECLCAAQTVGTLECAHGGIWRGSNLYWQSSLILALVGEQRAASICCYGAIFQALFDLRCHLHKAIQGRVRILPIHSRRRGICPRGT
jgi:hypothetical protein